MHTITEPEIINAVSALVIRANQRLPRGVTAQIERAKKAETHPVACQMLNDIVENLECASAENLPICQDTGFYTVFAELGTDAHLKLSRSLCDVISDGVAQGCKEGALRLCTADPLTRVNLNTGAPAVVYCDLVPGEHLILHVLPKGFGSENMARQTMLLPTCGKSGIVDFVVSVIKDAGSRPCPPLFIGVGIGGTFDYAAVLSKKALLREAGAPNPDPELADLETEILNAVNDLGIGVQGVGGAHTALAVAVERYPTHIAGLPVAVNPCCHVCRHQSAVL